MADPVFPTLPSGKAPDSSKYEVSKVDPAMRSEAEGGYTISRARFTRKPRRKFKIAYTFIDNADKQLIDDFYDMVCGGSVIFKWTDPQSSQDYSVRFIGQGLTFSYVGIGGNDAWDCSFELQQA
jgi:hypothetical protein